MTGLSRRQVIGLLLIFTIILGFGSMPYWAAARAEDGRWSFDGTYFDAQDYAVHIAMIRSGMQGAWGYSLRFTSETQRPAFLRMFYVLLGELNRLVQAPPETLFQVMRWLLGYAALLPIFLLARRCFRDEDASWVWLAFFLAVLGGGLGWIQRMLGWLTGPITPVDYWLIDGYVFMSLSLFPHFALTLAGMGFAYLAYLDYLRDNAQWRLGVVIVCALVVQLINPIAFLVVDVALAVATLVHWLNSGRNGWRQWISLGLIGIVQIPLFLYNLYVLTQLPLWRQFTAQNHTPSPPPVNYVMGFGLFWLPALYGTYRAWRKRDSMLLSSAAWGIATFVLAYLPVGIQVRFLIGVTIPLGLLATRGLADAFSQLSARRPWLSRRRLPLTLLMAAMYCMTAITFSLAQAAYMSRRPVAYFYPRQMDKAFDWITHNTGPDDLVLSAEQTGQLVAQKTGRRVFLGHAMETLNFLDKERDVEAYYNGNTPGDRLPQDSIAWVIYGPYERQIAPDFTPGPELEPVFRSPNVSIYTNLRYRAP